MQLFELRFFDATTLVLVRRFSARDDASAMAEARASTRKHMLEVWQDERLVGRVEKLISSTAVSR